MATQKHISENQRKKLPVARNKEQRASSPKASSDAIDAQLIRYHSMRDFTVTAEPYGKEKTANRASKSRLPFVIQKHAASHLHYDFRLGWNGVLKSWACAKGPSYYPGDRRLAVQVEDHPIEYGGFEGIIPAGQYGGGTVMLWDQGTWEPQAGHTDIDAGLRNGSLKFTMYGTKLKGNWTLIRMSGKAAKESKPNWLLIKEHDSFERSEKDKAITEEVPDSVVTQRSLEQIAASEDHVWNSNQTAKGNAWHRNDAPPVKTKSAIASPSYDFGDAKKESLPKFVAPQLAAQALAPPHASGWISELKLDGYRMQARLADGRVELLTRSGLAWTNRMSEIAAEVSRIPAKTALLDGEVVVLRADGTTSFADLQAAFQDGAKKSLTYYVFDLLHLNGHNLRPLPLLRRRSILDELLKVPTDALRISEYLETDAASMFHKACELKAEGIVSKRSDASYTSGRSTSWLKLKCIHEQEFVVGGFTLPSKGHAGTHGIGSLLLGYYDDKRRLIYAGRSGTGFTRKTHGQLRTRLDALHQAKNPFYRPPDDASKDAIWVKPELVAQIRFATWTADDLLRQASFQGLREDKPAEDVQREELAAKPRTARRSASHITPANVVARKLSRIDAPPIRLTHPEKVLDPESQLTKQQLADYYWEIAPHMLPQIAGRPVSLVRCPEGSTKPCFFQKHVTAMLPPGVVSVEVPDKKTGKLAPYITLSTPEALAGLAQMGVLEVHPWGSRNDDLEHPDRIIIDLDPDTAVSWKTLASAATDVRKRLKKLGLESFLKSTGGKGLHVVVPIEPKHDWGTIKEFAHTFVLAMETSEPGLYLTKMTKSARAGKIYLDYLRNERGATAVAAFSPRARAGASVSLPLPWSDLRQKDRPVFRVSDYPSWKARLKHDPWEQFAKTHQQISLEWSL